MGRATDPGNPRPAPTPPPGIDWPPVVFPDIGDEDTERFPAIREDDAPPNREDRFAVQLLGTPGIEQAGWN